MQIKSSTAFKGTNDIEYYRKNFSQIRNFLDSPQEYSLNQKRILYKHFFEGERKNFTRSNLVKWDMYRTDPETYPRLFNKYLNEACYESNEIQDLRLKAIQEKQEIYPKTRYTRGTLVKESRVTLDKIQPKLKGFQKFLLRIKTLV